MEREQHACNTGQRRRNNVGDLFVALRRIADEASALLVLTDGKQNRADG